MEEANEILWSVCIHSISEFSLLSCLYFPVSFSCFFSSSPPCSFHSSQPSLSPSNDVLSSILRIFPPLFFSSSFCILPSLSLLLPKSFSPSCFSQLYCLFLFRSSWSVFLPILLFHITSSFFSSLPLVIFALLGTTALFPVFHLLFFVSVLHMFS